MEGLMQRVVVQARERDLGWWVVAGLCFALVSGATWGLATVWARLGVFDQYNVIFDADAGARLECFASGWGGDCRSLVHPNLANFVNPPIRVVGAVLDGMGVGGASPEETREWLALWVSPVASGMQSVVLLMLARLLGFRLPGALLVALIGGLSFSQLVFGSVPEHFALSGLALSAALLLAADLARGGRVRWVGWAAIGSCAAGVTVVNAIPVAIAFLAGAVGAGMARRRMIAAFGALAVITVVLNGVVAVGFNRIYHDEFALGIGHGAAGSDGRSGGTLSGWVSAYFVRDAASKVQGFPLAVGHAIAAPDVGLTANALADGDRARYRNQFTLADGHGVLETLWGGALVVCVVVGGWLAFQRGGVYRALAWACAGILVFNGVLHAVWGVEYFLYSQHWNFATVVLLSACIAPPLPLARTVIASAVLGVIVWSNAVRLDDMLSRLS